MEFRVSAVNKAGVGKPSEVTILTAKPPSKPGQPEVSDIQKTSAVLSWTEPESDGGSPVIGYVVEKREKGRDRWVRVNRKAVTELTMKIPDLVEKNSYEFRVLAENKAGLGEPSETSSSFVAKALFGKISVYLYQVWHNTSITITR